MAPLWLLREDQSKANDALWAWARAGLTARAVRGAKMRTVSGVMDEFSAAWQFPDYFGENWGAFDECFAAMDWLLPTAGFLLMVYDAEQVLVDDSNGQLEILVKIISAAVDGYSKPVEKGNLLDRPAVPMRVMLQAADEAAAVQRWTAAGALVRPYEGMAGN